MLPSICRWAPRNLKAKPVPIDVPRDHTFPPFYACYVLRSLGTRPRGRKTYIGTTTDPVRRLRQHNGELAQGARKTSLDRPWIMSMLVHGFPSKLHALQFEWALQHPWKSRHLAHHFPTMIGRSRLPRIVSVVRTMICSPTYHAWPLHVTLLDVQAVEAWKAAAAAAGTLPVGCKVNTKKLRVTKAGVQDLSKAGFDVADAGFNEAILAKQGQIETLRETLCSICKEGVNISQPLMTTVCPSDGCTSVSHIDCIRRDFASQAQDEPMLPRSGTCKQCNKAVLWGDIIRSCYHRHRQATASAMALEEDDLELDEEVEEAEDKPETDVLPIKKKGMTRKSISAVPGRKGKTDVKASKRKPRSIAISAKITAKSKATVSRAKVTSAKSSNTKPKSTKPKAVSPSETKTMVELPKRGRPAKTDAVVTVLVGKPGRREAIVSAATGLKPKKRLKA
ncbi:hypothetical protein CALCODRAFT_446386 [Calocera cornea HHB12733]|uniref:GIY-YIG domain-containing protein n=1 Tax=Calocera cornea HHB12733 TaxID=1353952 RepID=A0A165JQP4_9BASI|nr:hypothetical protein CALCODRAFT_446386 [Calocera cornea HHB12733]